MNSSPSATDFPSWLQNIKADIAKRGLAAVWSDRFGEIARWNTRGVGDLLGDGLRQLLVADPSVKLGPVPAVQPSKPVVKGVLTNLPGVVESTGAPVTCLAKEPFANWGRTVANVPSVTATPKTKVGVCNLVKWAAAQGMTVRGAGYRHTWGDLYSGDGEVLVSLLPLDVAVDLPASEPAMDPSDELQGIQVVGTVTEAGVIKALCRIGAGTTNEQFRRWCLDPKGGALTWTIPLNVIMVEITWGGSNAPICHGAGLRNPTLSDLVTAVESVNAKGELQVVSDTGLLKSASGAFGLLGIVTSITLKLDPMTYASMTPLKQRLGLTVPPPAGFAVPSAVDMTGITPAALASATADFVRRCENDYYAEWFWFTFQAEGWINTWDNSGTASEAKDYPGDVASMVQAAEEYAAGLMVESGPFNALSEEWQTLLLGGGAMYLLPSGVTIVTPLIDALHFRRGIQNMRVWDMELEIPIPPLASDPSQPDWSICQQAWWLAVAEVYSTFAVAGKVPMRLTLEMRIMGGSGVTMAPQFGNTFGTCSIEILTTINTDPAEWAAFMQAVADRWYGLRATYGATLNIRPHWAKQWQGLTVDGGSMANHLRNVAYKDRIPEFGAGLRTIAAAGGYAMADMKARFSNPVLESVLGGIYTGP